MIRVTSDVPGRLRLGLALTGQPGEFHWRTDTEVGELLTVAIELLYGAIDLPCAATDFSGHAGLTGVLDPVEGPRREGYLSLWFHPDEVERWVFYDEAVRDRTFDGGRLSESARSPAARRVPFTPAYVREGPPQENPQEAEAGDHE